MVAIAKAQAKEEKMNERKMVATESTESFLARVKSVAHKLDGQPAREV